MDERLRPEENRELGEGFKNLERRKLSDSRKQAFFQELDNLPEEKPSYFPSALKEKIFFGLQDIRDSISGLGGRPIPAFAKVALLMFIVVSVYLFSFLPNTPVVHNVGGTVKIYNSRRNIWSFAKNNQKLRRGDILKTFKNGRADLSMGSLYSMRLRRDSELKVESLGSKIIPKNIRFHVAKGKVFAYYSGYKEKKKAKFELETNEAIAQVIGTNFMIESMPKIGKTWLGVLDGVVKITSVEIPQGMKKKDAVVYVRSKQKTEVSKGKLPEKPEPMMEDKWLELSELYSVGKKPQVALLISANSSRTIELLRIPSLYISDKKPGILPDKLREIASIFNQAVEDESKEKHIDSINRFKKIVREHPNPEYDVPFLLFIGAYYEHIGEHIKAVETFNEIIHKYPRSMLVSIAHCAKAIIYEEKLRDTARAEIAYQTILTKYPESPEADVARTGIDRLSN